jgi:NAD(P)H-nitrite reductase large subunit
MLINGSCHSAALHQEAERRGVRIEFGKRLMTYGVTGDGRVAARFQDGSEQTGDLLIGSQAAPHRQVQRAKALLLAADGVANSHMAQRIGSRSTHH